MMLPFTKCHANGNDFIITHLDDFPEEKRSKHIIDRLCCRNTGIGADGLFVVSPSEKYDFILDYYNSDGSWETLCANGSRCAVRFMNQLGSVANKSTFLAGDGPHAAEILKNGTISMQMKTPVYRSKLLSPAGCDGYFVDVGARHFVTETENLNYDFVFSVGRKIRNSHEFQPHGINVNFFKQIKENEINVISYEKGIEKVMLSCGSGSVAATFHANNISKMASPTTIKVPGGKLKLKFDSSWKNVWLGGSAVILFQSSINLDSISL